MSFNIENIEKENIKVLISYRSLYILKKKFEIYHNGIEEIYNSNKTNKYFISLDNLSNILKKILIVSNCLIIYFKDYNELIDNSFILNLNVENSMNIINSICEYIKNNLEKYNKLYFEKRLKKSIDNYELKDKEKKDNEENIKEENEKKEENKDNEEKINEENIKEKYKEKEENKEKEVNIDDEENKENEENKEGEEKNKQSENNENKKEEENKQNDDSINEEKKEEEEKENKDNKENDNKNDEEEELKNLEKNISNLNLYPQLIPLIIADFIQDKENIAIISSNNELNPELKNLFDEDLSKKIFKMNHMIYQNNINAKIKNYLLEEMNIKQQINFYKDICFNKHQFGQNKENYLKIIDKLYSQKNFIKSKIISLRNQNFENNNKLETLKDNYTLSSINLNNNNIKKIYLKKKIKNKKEEIRENNIKTIFTFYCKQHGFYGSNPSFDLYKNSEENLSISDFIKFCNDFKINVKLTTINQIFKTSSEIYGKDLNLNNFYTCLKKLSIAINNEKIEKIKEKINSLENKIKKLSNNNVNQNNKNLKKLKKKSKPKNEIKLTIKVLEQQGKDNMNEDEIIKEIEKLKEEENLLNLKTENELLEELYKYINIDNQLIFEKKLIGYNPYMKIIKNKISKNQKFPKIKSQSYSPSTFSSILKNFVFKREKKIQNIKEKEKENLYYLHLNNLREKNEILKNHLFLKVKQNYERLFSKQNNIKKGRIYNINWEQISNNDCSSFLFNENKKIMFHQFNQYMNMNDVFNFAKDNTTLDYEDKELIKFFEKKD